MSSHGDGKGASLVLSEVARLSPEHGANSPRDPDQAYLFLKKIGAAHGQGDQLNLKNLRRKIDWRIVPMLFCCYTMQFIDKVLLNVSLVTLSLVCLLGSLFAHLTVCGYNGVE
jgi:hypothetical protein